MAATNYTPIQLYYSTTASAAPSTGNLLDGELAINIRDGKLYYKDYLGAIQVIATKGAGTIGGSDTQIQYNNAGALAGSADMTYTSATNTVLLTKLNLTNALGATYGGTGLSSYTTGDLLYSSATNTLSKLALGTANYILTVNSAGTNVQWSAPSAISVSTATNLAGGVAGSVPYQSGASTTTFLAIGAANRVMTSSGSAPQWVTALTSLTGVSSSSITNTSLTSGRVVYSTTGGAETDSANLTFDGTTLTTTGLSNSGTSALVKLVTVGNTSFNGTTVFAAATPAKLYMGNGTVTDTTSAIGATNAVGAVASLAITPIAASNTSVTYTNASTLYIAGAPSAGTNITITNPYALYVNAGASYFAGNLNLGSNLNLPFPANVYSDSTVRKPILNTSYDGTSNTDYLQIGGPASSSSGIGSDIRFNTGTFAAYSEKARIESIGNFLVGTTSALSSAVSGRRELSVNGASAGAIISLGSAGTRVGYLTNDGTDMTLMNETASGTLKLGTNSGTRLTIDANGDTGLGIAPSTGVRLYIYAPNSTDAQVRIAVPTGTQATYISYVNTTVTKVGTENSAGGSLASGSSAYASIISNNGAYPVQIGTNNVIRATVDSAGKVGIGVIPQTLLHMGQGTFGLDSPYGTSSAVPAFTSALIAGEIHANSPTVSSGGDGGVLRISAGGETSASAQQKSGMDFNGYNTTDGGPKIRMYAGSSSPRAIIDYNGGFVVGNTSTSARLESYTTTAAQTAFLSTNTYGAVSGKAGYFIIGNNNGSNGGGYGIVVNDRTDNSGGAQSGYGIYVSAPYDGGTSSGGNYGLIKYGLYVDDIYSYYGINSTTGTYNWGLYVKGGGNNYMNAPLMIGSASYGYGTNLKLLVYAPSGSGSGTYTSISYGSAGSVYSDLGQGRITGGYSVNNGYIVGFRNEVSNIASTGAHGKLDIYALTANAGGDVSRTGSYFRIEAGGIITFPQYGAGTLSTNGSGVISASDGRFKNKTRPVENGLDAVMQLQPTYYRWKDDCQFHTEHEEIGFIAQEVAAVIPEASQEPEEDPVLDENGDILTVKYKNFHDRAIIAVMVKAIQELKAEFDAYKASHP